MNILTIRTLVFTILCLAGLQLAAGETVVIAGATETVDRLQTQPLTSGSATSSAIAPVTTPVDTDWLLNPKPFTAELIQVEDADQILLDNGLVRRTFVTKPNGATIGYDNRTSGQAVLRAVKPEAVVTLNGHEINVGGLVGQPNHAFLTSEFVDAMRAEAGSMRLVDIELGEPKPRLDWLQVRHHAPDVEWPPKGVYLKMNYRLSREDVQQMTLGQISDLNGLPSATARDLLFQTVLENISDGQLPQPWLSHVSTSDPQCSVTNEGKSGEINTAANTAAFLKRELTSRTTQVEATIDVGTDVSSSWGPGIAWVYPNGHIVKFYIRTGGDANSDEPALAVMSNTGEQLRINGSTKLDLTKPITLRMRRDDPSHVALDARQHDGSWQNFGTIPVDPSHGSPTFVQVGKMDTRGGTSDYTTPGDRVRLRILQVAAYGPLDVEQLQASGDGVDDLSYLADVTVSVHYELYDGVPVISKWITVQNNSDRMITVDRFTSELIAAVEYQSDVEDRGVAFTEPNLHVETDYAFGAFTHRSANRMAVHWVPDPEYSTQVNYRRVNPCLLRVGPEVGPSQDIAPAGQFESFRTFELCHDSNDRERKGLALRRMYRTIAPWVTENPLMMHVRYANWDAVKKAIDQCAEVGFEMVILTFGSGFEIENNSPEYLAQMKSYSDYAKSKGIEIGGYSLLASRSVGGGNDVVSPAGETPTFGKAPALTSKWGQEYFAKLYHFYRTTGFGLLEHDGSYPGDRDVTPRPPFQKGADDSRWVQWRMITDFYKFCRANGVYLNVPDYYYLAGSSKCGMGYRETNWSLPRAQQLIHCRQNIYDGSWEKCPSMGWMFVPLTQYHGGGAAATIEPLDEHLEHYRQMLQSNLGLGVQACYRGPRLYDTDRTREMVKGWVDWFKQYRDILESDLIHGRRADGRDIDWLLHVNPQLDHRGMAVIFNPLNEPVTRTIRLPLYYTGLRESAAISISGSEPVTHPLDRDSSVKLELTIPAGEMTWLLVTEPVK